MPERKAFAFDISPRRRLQGVLDLPDEPGLRPTVVDCHGFKGFMEWGFHPYVADLLAARGFTVARFNFASSGMQPGDEVVTDEIAFSTTTVGQDVEEILAVLTALADGKLAQGRVDPERLSLLGHSRGGGTSVLASASSRWNGRLRALVTWAGVGTFDRVSEADKEAWRQLGALPVVNARTGQRLELDCSLLDDGEKNSQDYDVEAAASRRTAPWLLLHGDADETVHIAEAHTLAAAATGEVEMHTIEGGSHTFGAQHPFSGPTPALIEAMNRTQLWLRRHLAP